MSQYAPECCDLADTGSLLARMQHLFSLSQVIVKDIWGAHALPVSLART